MLPSKVHSGFMMTYLAPPLSTGLRLAARSQSCLVSARLGQTGLTNLIGAIPCDGISSRPYPGNGKFFGTSSLWNRQGGLVDISDIGVNGSSRDMVRSRLFISRVSASQVCSYRSYCNQALPVSWLRGSPRPSGLGALSVSKSSYSRWINLSSQVTRLGGVRVSRTGIRALATAQPDEKKQSKVPMRKKLLTSLTPHENIYTVPNILTFSRILAAPFVGYFIATSQHSLAFSLFAYAGITDLVDGFIARRFKMQSVVGTIIDPMADKLLMTISVVALAMRNGIPWWLASLILLRDVGLAISAIYYRWISLPPPKTMKRYWDFSLPSAEVKPTGISKFNTFLQLVLVGSGVALPIVPAAILHEWSLIQAFEMLQYTVAFTTVWSGASYVYSKDAVKILTQEEVEARLANKEKKEQQ